MQFWIDRSDPESCLQCLLQQMPVDAVLENITTVTFNPSCAALIAATYPPGPDPITTRSASWVPPLE